MWLSFFDIFYLKRINIKIKVCWLYTNFKFNLILSLNLHIFIFYYFTIFTKHSKDYRKLLDKLCSTQSSLMIIFSLNESFM